MKANEQEYIDYVKTLYPNMIVDFWYSHGELHFYPSENSDPERVHACVRVDGKFIIKDEF